jgi:hypothetical protein
MWIEPGRKAWAIHRRIEYTVTRLIGSHEIFQASSKVVAIVATAMHFINRADALSCGYNPISLEQRHTLGNSFQQCTDGTSRAVRPLAQ